MGTGSGWIVVALVLAGAGPAGAALPEGGGEPLDRLGMGIALFGGLALFLYGMEKMTDGLKAAAGEQMKVLLAKLTRNPVSGAVTGALVTAVIQSSSVTTVLVVGFVSAGLMTLVQSVGVIFGANVGTTITAQIVAFNVTAAALPLITVGFAMNFLSKGGRAGHYGDMLMGLGLIFYGMAAMGQAMAPLRVSPGFIELMQSMENPLLGMLVGAVFTALVQSSSATISLAVVMATQGLVTLPAGIAIVFGAKIGTCVTALLASLGKPRDALRAAVVHVTYNVLGALVWVAFIEQLAAVAVWISPTAPELRGAERAAAEVPRQIANAATMWAVANVVIFLPMSALFARFARRIVPDRVEVETTLVTPRFLDDTLVQVPSLALERARLELGHMAELAEEAAERVPTAFRARDTTELTKRYEATAVLRTAILDYLQRIGRQTLTDEEAAEHARVAYAAAEIEHLCAAMTRELAPLVEEFAGAGLSASDATNAMLEELYGAVHRAASEGLKAIVDRDERAAQEVVAQREVVWRIGTEVLTQQAARLAEDDPQRLLKHRLQVDVLDKLRRIYAMAEDMAVSVLPGSALAR